MKQRGILLLPVALTLALVATLAYTMTSEGSMNVSAVDAQYDVEVARYVAASGIQVAKWRAAKSDCNVDKAKLGTLDVPGGRVTVDDKVVTMSKGILKMSLSATTNRKNGTAQTLGRTLPVFDFNAAAKEATLIGKGDDDTTLVRPPGTAPAKETLEATDGNAHPLLSFILPPELADKGSLIQAILKITKQSGNSTQPYRALGVHRVTREWKTPEATWALAYKNVPWATPGGDYAEPAAASVKIDPGTGADNGAYTVRVDSLVQSWADGTYPNYGMLLKPTGLLNALFVSFDGGEKPQLTVRYFKRCK
jgi:hypothetical protein